MKSKQIDYFEPWTARRKATAQPHPFPHGIPEGADPAAADRAIDAYLRVSQSQDWYLWGSGMAQPTETLALLSPGEIVHCDDQRIVAAVRRMVAPEDAVSPEQVAKRIAACVNAMAGVHDPEKFMDDLREHLAVHASENEIASELIAACEPRPPRSKQETVEHY